MQQGVGTYASNTRASSGPAPPCGPDSAPRSPSASASLPASPLLYWSAQIRYQVLQSITERVKLFRLLVVSSLSFPRASLVFKFQAQAGPVSRSASPLVAQSAVLARTRPFVCRRVCVGGYVCVWSMCVLVWLLYATFAPCPPHIMSFPRLTAECTHAWFGKEQRTEGGRRRKRPRADCQPR